MRLETYALARDRQALFETARVAEAEREPEVRFGARRIACNRESKETFFARGVPAVVVLEHAEAQRYRRGIRRELLGAFRRGAPARPAFPRGDAAVKTPSGPRLRKRHVRLVEIGVALDGRLELRDRLVQPAPVPEIAAFQEAIVGDDVARRGRDELCGRRWRAARSRGDRDRRRFRRERRGNRARELVLDREDVGQVAIPALGPKVVAGLDVDELGRHAQALPRLTHAAVEHRGNAELGADPPYVVVLAAERERRRACRNPQAGHARKRRDHVLGHALAEVLALGAAADGAKEQHGDRCVGRALRNGRAHAALRRRRASDRAFREPQREHEVARGPKPFHGLLLQAMANDVLAPRSRPCVRSPRSAAARHATPRPSSRWASRARTRACP